MSVLASAWLPALALVIWTMALRRYHKTWLAPGVLFAGVWSGAVIGPLILAPDYEVSTPVVWWIFALTMTLGGGGVLGMGIGTARWRDRDDLAYGPAQLGRHLLPRRLAVASVWGFALLGLLGTVMYVKGLGMSASHILSLDALLETGRTVSVARYHEQYSGTTISRILLLPVYLGALIAGHLMARHKSAGTASPRAWATTAAALLPCFVMGLVMTTKSSLLFGLVLWLASYLATRIQLDGRNYRFEVRRHILTAIAIAAALLGIFVFLNLVRYGWVGSGRSFEALARIRVYAAGHLGALSYWYEREAVSLLPSTYGRLTLAGLFDALGLHDRSSGVISDSVVLADGSVSNVYSYYRGLISDFGLLGAVTANFGIGVTAGLAFSSVGRGSALALVGLTSFYLFAVWSPITSVFNYNTFIASLALLTLFVIRKRRKADFSHIASLYRTPEPA